MLDSSHWAVGHLAEGAVMRCTGVNMDKHFPLSA
jgi:hypothetical protein